MWKRGRKKKRKQKTKSSAVTQESHMPERTEEKNATNFNLVIPPLVMQKIFWWINKSSHEVSGFGHLDHDPDTNTFTVRDAILIKQEVGPTSTEIDPVALGKAMFETRAEHNALKWHWHSHVDMGVFWSADDKELIRSLAQQGWIVASVFNKKKECRTAFSGMCEVLGMPHEIFVDNIPTCIETPLAEHLIEQWDGEYAEKVAPERRAAYQPGYPGEAYSRYPMTKQYPPHQTRTTDEDSEAEEMKKVLPIGERDDGAPVRNVTYDDYGHKYVYSLDRWIYNPHFDRSLQTDRERMEEITQMDPEEIDYLRKDCVRFETTYRRFLIEQAQGGANGRA